MSNFLKAVFVTALTVVPLGVKEYLGEHWNWWWFAAYCLAAFFGYWKLVFRPDERFNAVCTPSLDNCFETTFANVQWDRKGRFPFCVNVYRPIGFWPAVLLLVVAYHWKSNPTDSDHGKWWFSWCGLVGKTYWSGLAGFYKKGDDLSGFGLTKRDEERTNHLEGLLCLPLRRPAPKGSWRVSDRVTAVLAVNALTPEAAEELAAWYEDIDKRRINALVDKANWLSLYF